MRRLPSSPESQWFHATETFVLEAESADIAAPAMDSHRRGPVRPADWPDVSQIDACQPGDDRRLHCGIDEDTRGCEDPFETTPI